MGWSNAIFETGCQVIINFLNGPNSVCPWENRVMVEDIKVWASTRRLVFLMVLPREQEGSPLACLVV
ncbi:hypothetical protein RHMOL_Rhmol10G0077200 [Rhododendron molle]|uniref:Uncharacterized protein n=1 Tax=Rhododendron molle TaxID=49168 RepID=A0ACC0M0J1_RHOML|nr:hypothetical protein RHMOL_Rhmol10G0077200 [Rhododendron molle]